MPPHCSQSVHPRTRGEQFITIYKRSGDTGSSPHTRGTGSLSRPGSQPSRFIPAHAGNSSDPAVEPALSTVHPRTRGEQDGFHQQSRHATGSSPHTRGTGHMIWVMAARGRFIPAHAGNRHRSAPVLPCRSVHPRTRGEQGMRQGWSSNHSGSSPHTRGTAARSRSSRERHRFIPAHAGNRCQSAVMKGWLTVHPRTRGEQGLRVG